MVKTPVVLKGTLRIKTKDLKVYEKTSDVKDTWKKTSVNLSEAIKVIEHFKAHDNFETLIDVKNPKFLKGQLYKNKLQGARINILPDGRKLDKAYSLFAPHLTLHDETSNEHWDVIYMNPNGAFAYLYTLDKKSKASERKYKKVKQFDKVYDLIKTNVSKALKNTEDITAIPIYTLLKTYMRVGNEIYFRTHGHKGLTTLTKGDISIDGTKVEFNYLAKDGVPRTITETFPKKYVERLKHLLEPLEESSFIFTTKTGHPLHDVAFKKAFKEYCGIEFYPHIVRSHYATNVAKEFLKGRKSATKKEVKTLFLSIADKLGHKHFNKKHNEWEDNFSVTIHHYIEPVIVEKIKNLIN